MSTFEEMDLAPRPAVTVTEGSHEDPEDEEIEVDHDGISENEALGLLLKGIATLLGLVPTEED